MRIHIALERKEEKKRMIINKLVASCLKFFQDQIFDAIDTFDCLGTDG